MILVYSFIGKLPSYIVETIYQCRLYYNGIIYLIIDDLQSIFIEKLTVMNVNIIDYSSVKDDDFLQLAQNNKHKFMTLPKLGDRSLLFLRAFERFYLLCNLMRQKSLENVLFVELDNLLYDNPLNWLNVLSNFEIAFMIDNKDRIGSGIFYAKNHEVLSQLTTIYNTYIIESDTKTEFVCEMHANAFAMKKLKSLCILPTIFEESIEAKQIPQIAENFENFGSVLFDSSAYGIYLLGLDPYHTEGRILLYQKNPGALIDCSRYQLEWQFDIKDGLRKPYIKRNDKWIPIVNLHVHSKELFAGLSQPFQNKSAIFIYGAAEKWLSVTKQADKEFTNKNNLIIPKNLSFNELFGDVLPNKKKSLEIRFLDDGTTINLPEKRSKDYLLAFSTENE